MADTVITPVPLVSNLQRLPTHIYNITQAMQKQDGWTCALDPNPFLFPRKVASLFIPSPFIDKAVLGSIFYCVGLNILQG